MDNFFPRRKKPIAFLAPLPERSIIKGEGLFRFSTQVVVLLVVAEMILAFLAALGIETAASDGLAIFFALIIGVWLMGVLVWFLFDSLARKLSGPAPPSKCENAEDTIEDKLLSSDTMPSLSIQVESDRETQRPPQNPAREGRILDLGYCVIPENKPGTEPDSI